MTYHSRYVNKQGRVPEPCWLTTLQLLMKGPRTAAEIKKITGRSLGTILNVLEKLEEEGLAKCEWQEKVVGLEGKYPPGQPHRVYTWDPQLG